MDVTSNNYLPFTDHYFDMAITYGCFSAVKKRDLSHFFSEIVRTTKGMGVFIEYLPEKDWNVFQNNYYWYKHDYHSIFRKYNYLQKQLNGFLEFFFMKIWETQRSL